MPTAPHSDEQRDVADGALARDLHGTPRHLMPVPLRKGVYVLPNLITTAGLFCGFYSIIATISAEYQAAALCILIAHVFDGLDGRIARLTKSSSRFGIEYGEARVEPADLQ